MKMKSFIYLVFILNVLSLGSLQKSEVVTPANAIPGAACRRQCRRNDYRTCYFNFIISHTYTMGYSCRNCPQTVSDCFLPNCTTGDGFPRAITVINNQMPGPMLEVCKYDRIIVDVKNSLPLDTASIHWHGMLQEGTPYSDGVPFITQCPIQPGDTFRYNFIADDSGTHFYHSHSGLQRVDGVTGSLIIREPADENPFKQLYDFDLPQHVIFYFDWDHELAASKYVGLNYHPLGKNTPDSLLVNGRGRNYTYGNPCNETYTPTARFHVKQGYRYRFRLINSGNLDCPIMVSIDGHLMTVISSDGNDVWPRPIDSLMTLAGERYDFILHANQTGGVFWIKFQGHLQCNAKFNGVRQVAVLQYDDVAGENAYPPGHPTYEEAGRNGLELNPLNKPRSDHTSITIAALRSIKPMPEILSKKPDLTVYLPIDLRNISNPIAGRKFPTPQISNITFHNLHYPLLSQRSNALTKTFCNSTSFKRGYCDTNFCTCPHVVQLPYKKLVEVVVINESHGIGVNHPFHLHGYKFRVVAYDKVGNTTSEAEIRRLDRQGKITRNLFSAPIKDTFNIPPGGYTIIRFYTCNPGYWLFHCHIDHHVEEGMNVVFKVGEHRDMAPIPKNFPECGDYKPKVSPRLPFKYPKNYV